MLRDVLVGLLAADHTLQPSDILVMCPDIEAYAPLIQGAFGLDEVVAGGHPAHGLRVRLADRALTQTNPLLATVERLLDLADGRVTASQVLDLAGWAPVRRRFGFDDDELERLAAWAAESGARWGLDAAHRTGFRVGRLSAEHLAGGAGPGVAGGGDGRRGQQHRLGVALPLDDVGSSDVDLAGRFAELLARLTAALDALSGDRPVARLARRADHRRVDSLTSVSSTNGWQSAELRREMAKAEQTATEAGAGRLLAGQVRHPGAARRAGSPADPPGPTSAPAPSPCAPWCRCDRCRTGWSACWGWTTGSSRAPPGRTATTCWPGNPRWGSGTCGRRTGS